MVYTYQMVDFESIDTPLGPVVLIVNASGDILELYFASRRVRALPCEVRRTRVTAKAVRATKLQLGEYFSGNRKTFELALSPRGSSFEQKVWDELLRIPYGCTTTYGRIARTLGVMLGARAVGKANGANPIPIIIPCHRVIGSTGRMVGYGPGIDLKERLLELEGAAHPSFAWNSRA